MTDLEMTKLCAEAMGLELFQVPEYGDVLFIVGDQCEYGNVPYEPLEDDAQAMALVKRFNLGDCILKKGSQNALFSIKHLRWGLLPPLFGFRMRLWRCCQQSLKQIVSAFQCFAFWVQFERVNLALRCTFLGHGGVL